MEPEDVQKAVQRFRRRPAPGQAAARRRYLSPTVRQDAERMRDLVDHWFSSMVDSRVKTRVKRIRAGATVEESRFRKPKK